MIPKIFETAYECCELCPRRCRVNRYEKKGFCGAGTEIRAAKAMIHLWEEPVLGERSGAVFFSNCTLKCVYCQNFRISHEGFGKVLTPRELSDAFLRLQDEGAQNIDLVTPAHYLPGILKALELCKPKLSVPVVYNCGGYERAEILKLLEGYVDIWLPDVKYFSDEMAFRYSSAKDAFRVSCEALAEMIRQKKAGSSKEVIVRHMVLPGGKDDSVKLLLRLAERFGTEDFLLSLMSQYTPFYKASEYPEINRRLTSYEYDRVLRTAVELGFSGFMQERTSAKEEYTPEFDLGGL